MWHLLLQHWMCSCLAAVARVLIASAVIWPVRHCQKKQQISKLHYHVASFAKKVNWQKTYVVTNNLPAPYYTLSQQKHSCPFESGEWMDDQNNCEIIPNITIGSCQILPTEAWKWNLRIEWMDQKQEIRWIEILSLSCQVLASEDWKWNLVSEWMI